MAAPPRTAEGEPVPPAAGTGRRLLPGPRRPPPLAGDGEGNSGKEHTAHPVHARKFLIANRLSLFLRSRRRQALSAQAVANGTETGRPRISSKGLRTTVRCRGE